jgi:acyl transferase domain-containing protein
MRDAQYLAADCATGNGIAIMSNRISYFFDIHGPSITIDTGCSASLICIHQAVQSLLNGESSMVSSSVPFPHESGS